MAFPADPGNSGVMTFVVNQTGRIYEKDLGDAGRALDSDELLAALPSSFLDVTPLLTDRCAARRAPVGSLVVRGRDHVPAPPDASLRSVYSGGAGGID